MAGFKLKKVASVGLAIMIPFTFTGCGKKSDCEIPASHLHLYTKDKDGKTISLYLNSENLIKNGYSWNPEYITVTKNDEKAFNSINGYFDGISNWDYLFNYMKNHGDYFKFYWEYDDEIIVYEKDSEGNRIQKIEKEHKYGWTTNPSHTHNTGLTRLYHTRYHGYKIVCENGNYKLEKSKNVDDIRDLTKIHLCKHINNIYLISIN